MKKWFKMGTFGFFLLALPTLFTGCASNATAVKETQKPTVESAKSKRITQISIVEDSESSIVSVGGNQLLSYTSVKQPFPLGVLLYFPETALDKIQSNFTPESDIVAGIKSSELTDKGHASRIEISLKKDVPYEVVREDTGLKIVFKKTPPMSVSAKPELEKEEPSTDTSMAHGEQPAASDQKMLATQTETREITQPEVEKNSPGWINRIDFSSETAGQSTIIIGTTTPVKYNVKKINDKKLLLNLYPSKLPEYRQRPLITTRFQSAVDRITPFQAPAVKNTSGFVIELRDSVPYFIEQTDNLILVHFEASSVPPRPLDTAELPPWRNVMAEAVDKTDAPALKPSEHRKLKAQAEKYTGEKIAINFFETDIKNVFRILMDVSGKNFAIDKDVSGQVTLAFDKPVPWDQILNVILKMNRLGMVLEEDIIRIATLKTLNVEETELQAKIVAAQKHEEQKKALEPLITEYIPVNYANAKADVLPKIILTEGRGSISVDERNNQIIITDTAEKIKKAKEIVKQIDKVTPQVIIEARIVEASDNFSREFGTSWTIAGSKEDNSSLGGTLGYIMSATNPPTSSRGEIGIEFSRLVGNKFAVLDAKLMASESEGTLTIISAPKILTLDNTPATIKQGISYPYNKLDPDGNTTTEFKDIALELEVTPHVTPDSRIAMEITIKNNEIGAIINNQLSFTTKEANTKLLVDDGDTVIIAGIRKTREDRGQSGVPVLNKIPVLGWLFKTESKTDEK
ncbi:MAG: type IV pilus secretin PilQ, partial [Desulfobacteraceae bacterium]|nr:type IV pilus secretin PilQ [Desulfobacteraceae bacterium]